MAQGCFMEALMDFSVAIMLEKRRLADKESNNNKDTIQSGKDKNKKLHEYYRNAGQAHFELA